MTGGLQTIAAITSRVGWVLAMPPIHWELASVESFAIAGFGEGICWSVARRNDRVLMTAVAEAGAVFIAELDPADAMTAAALCAIEGT